MSYRVGQVVYVIMAREPRVVPLQVVEEVTKRTLDGESVEYIVRGRDAENTMAISGVEGEVFETAEKARKALVERATASVHKLVDKAVENARAWFTNVNEADLPRKPTKPVKPKAPTAVADADPDPNDPIQQFAQELINDRDEADDAGTFVKLADGTLARVTISPDKLTR